MRSHLSIIARLFLLTLTIFMLPACHHTNTPHAPIASAPTLKVMSFNIRLGVANDGPNHWRHRKDLVVQTIQKSNPDIFGTQEMFDFQEDYLTEKLNGYSVIARGRTKNGGDEQCGLFYRTNRFHLIDSGFFWLSQTPTEPGSRSWDSAIMRIVTWAILQDQTAPTAPPFLVYNTHFDHRGQIARTESAKLISADRQQRLPNGPAILLGDFNANELSDAYATFFKKHNDHPAPFIDTYRTIHPQAQANEATWTAFDPKNTNNRWGRIDWIGCTDHWLINSATIDRLIFNGRLPSDHFPVTATLQWRP